MRIRDRIKALRRVPARQLKHNPHKWRRHPSGQQSSLRLALERLGYVDALIVRETRRGKLELLDGHLRAELTPDTKVPVLIVDVNDAEAAEIVATFDPLGAMAEADGQALDALLTLFELDESHLRDHLQAIIDTAPEPEPTEGLADLDDVPEPPARATTKPGDLWLLGDHRLLCGDSSNASDIDRLLDGAAIHLVNTDPPYNVDQQSRSRRTKGKSRRPKGRPLTNDCVTDEEFARLLRAWFGNASRALLPGRAFYFWGGYVNIMKFPAAMAASSLHFSQAIIWVKGHPVLTRKDFMGNHEWCFYGWREGAPHVFLGPNNATDVWEVKKVHQASMVHLTEKPVELAARALQYSSRPGENVLDLFGGSGSTLMASEQSGRRTFLMELDAPYCDVIVERWQSFTGRKATRRRSKRSTPRKSTTRKT